MFFPFFPTLGVQNLFFPGRYLPVNTTVKTGYRPKTLQPCNFRIITTYPRGEWVKVQLTITSIGPGNGLASCDKPLPEPMMTQFMDAYECLPSSMCLQVEAHTKCLQFNSLAPGRFEKILRKVFFQAAFYWWLRYLLQNFPRMPLDLTDDKSTTLVQVMAWCRQATSHYLSQCWPRSLLPYGVTRPQWVKYMETLNLWQQLTCICIHHWSGSLFVLLS